MKIRKRRERRGEMKKKISYILLFLFVSISGVIADNDLTGDVSSDSFNYEYLLLEEDATPLVIYGVLQSGQDTQVMERSEIDALNPASVSDILTRGFNLSFNSLVISLTARVICG